MPPPGTNYTPLDVVKRLTIPSWDTSAKTNVVRMHFRALSGNLGDGGGNAVGFTYVVTSEVNNYTGDPNFPNRNYYLTNNLHEVKLTFQWPVYEATAGTFPTRFGNGRMVVRTLISGQLTNDSGGYVLNGTTYQGQ